jgi:hypothetical protein
VLQVGSGDPLTDGFRYRAITPITLEAGTSYTLAGTSGGQLDLWTVNDFASDFTVNPAFSLDPDSARFSYGTELADPCEHFSDYLVYAGPNLEGTVLTTATPEPAGLTLVLLGGAALLVLRRVRSLLFCR